MKSRTVIGLACLLLLIFSVTAFAGSSISFGSGYPENGIYTNVVLKADVLRLEATFNALETTLNDKTDDYSFVGIDLGYPIKSFTPFFTVARVSESHYQWVPDGESRKRELLSDNADTCFGAGVYGKIDLGRWVVDGSYRAFQYQEELNGIIKADLKYRVAGESYIFVGYGRWDDKADTIFSGFEFGMQLGW